MAQPEPAVLRKKNQANTSAIRDSLSHSLGDSKKATPFPATEQTLLSNGTTQSTTFSAGLYGGGSDSSTRIPFAPTAGFVSFVEAHLLGHLGMFPLNCLHQLVKLLAVILVYTMGKLMTHDLTNLRVWVKREHAVLHGAQTKQGIRMCCSSQPRSSIFILRSGL